MGYQKLLRFFAALKEFMTKLGREANTHEAIKTQLRSQ